MVATATGDSTTITLDADLDEDTTYWWTAAAVDALDAQSDFADALEFTVNTANTLPDAPVITNPSDGEELGTNSLDFTWEQVIDADGDTIMYEAEVASDSGFASVVFSETDIPSGAGDTVSVTVTGLEEDSSFFARVRAIDAEGAGPYAEVQFSVNAQNDAPSAPALISPIGGELVASKNVDFVWNNASDNENDTLTYTIELFADAAAAEDLMSVGAITELSGGTTSLNVTVNETGDVYWRVFATDEAGNAGPASELEMFTIKPVVVTTSGSDGGCCSTINAKPTRRPEIAIFLLVMFGFTVLRITRRR
jgi:hypothetical protein